ncbi:DUF2752 domain-containing protein [Tenacibaculum sp. nBUS_03]|uniref:DUF2752 domain-containing protein n=1 Tax=Tenacibaculum sp. nBUS_03 TaxID=3395320 RepID=UPI003EBD779B
MLPCLNKKIFGLDCLGCGFQRAIVFLLKGEFLAAFKIYPAIYSLLFFLVYILLNFKFKYNNSQKTIRFLLILNTILIVGNFILKIL